MDIAVTREGGRLKMAVADYGPGSDACQKGGTGLGLSISKAIVERLGGEIGFTTGKGKATTFYFFLPECSEPAGRASGQLHGGEGAAERDPAYPGLGRDRRHCEAFRPHYAVGADSRNLAKTHQLTILNSSGEHT